MARYFFVLGKNPTLSISEILLVLDKLKLPFSVEILSEEILVMSASQELPIPDLIKVLGGTIKIGKIFDEIGFDESQNKFEEIFLAQHLTEKYLPNTTGKLHFGISIYDAGSDRRILVQIIHQLKSLNKIVKENLQGKGFKAGFVRVKERYLSSVSVFKNQLLSHGAEIVLILTGEKILAGKTFAVQEFESFSFRDYGRPARDKRSGIIPPKLARMMINLSQISSDGVLLDPFCGSGTILQEAIILGYKNIIGGDISQNAIEDTKKNNDWLFHNFKNLDKSRYNIKIYQSDIRVLSQIIKSDSIDSVVTEPYLGPPLFKKPEEKIAEGIFSEVGKLYTDAFEVFHKILKPAGKVVFLFPAFEIYGRMYFVQILDKIEELGFIKKEILPEGLAKNPLLKVTSRNTIIYGSQEQFVKREITCWQKG